MKTPEEIKEGIEHCIKYLACVPTENCCDLCPYNGHCGALERDALAYIEQLEAGIAEWEYVAASPGAVEDMAREIDRLEMQKRQTAKRIQQLEAKVPKWISVKDKMPPTGNAVLVAVHNQKMAWSCVEVDVWDGRWLENADSEWHIITHWMPLPEPTEEV